MGIAGTILLCLNGCSGFKYTNNHGCANIDIDSHVCRFDSHRIELDCKTIITVNTFAPNSETLYLYPANNTCFTITLDEDVIEYEGNGIKVLSCTGNKHLTDIELDELRIQLSYDEVWCHYKSKGRNVYTDLFKKKCVGKEKRLYISSNGNELSLVCGYNWYNWSLL